MQNKTSKGREKKIFSLSFLAVNLNFGLVLGSVAPLFEMNKTPRMIQMNKFIRLLNEDLLKYCQYLGKYLALSI